MSRASTHLLFVSGLYARKNAIPSLTINDIRDVLIGFRSLSAQKSALVSWRETRSSQVEFNSIKPPYSITQSPFALYSPVWVGRRVTIWTRVTGSSLCIMTGLRIRVWRWPPACLMTSPRPVPGAALVRASVCWVSVNAPRDTTAKTAPSVSIKVQGVPKKPGLAFNKPSYRASEVS